MEEMLGWKVDNLWLAKSREQRRFQALLSHFSISKQIPVFTQRCKTKKAKKDTKRRNPIICKHESITGHTHFHSSAPTQMIFVYIWGGLYGKQRFPAFWELTWWNWEGVQKHLLCQWRVKEEALGGFRHVELIEQDLHTAAGIYCSREAQFARGFSHLPKTWHPAWQRWSWYSHEGFEMKTHRV